MKTTLNYRSRAKTTLDYRRGEQIITPIPVAEAAGESHFPTILLWHSQGRRKGDPKHKCCGKKSGFFRRSFCAGRELRRPKSDHAHLMERKQMCQVALTRALESKSDHVRDAFSWFFPTTFMFWVSFSSSLRMPQQNSRKMAFPSGLCHRNGLLTPSSII